MITRQTKRKSIWSDNLTVQGDKEANKLGIANQSQGRNCCQNGKRNIVMEVICKVETGKANEKDEQGDIEIDIHQ